MSEHPKNFFQQTVDYVRWRLRGRPVAAATQPTSIDEWLSAFESIPSDRESGPEPLLCVAVWDEFSAEHMAYTVKKQLAQTDDAWQLIVLVAAADKEVAESLLQVAAKGDQRISIAMWDAKVDASPASQITTFAESGAGSHILLIDSGTALMPTAVAWFRSCRDRADLVYADEILGDEDAARPVFKPDWSPTLAVTRSYLGEAILVRCSTLIRAGGYGDGLVDLARRLSKLDIDVCHLPNLLIERFHSDVVRGGGDTTARTIEDAPGIDASETRPVESNAFRWNEPVNLSIKVVIPTRDHLHLLQQAVATVLDAQDVSDLALVIVDNGSEDTETLSYMEQLARDHGNVAIVRDAEPFNFSRVCNRGAAHGDDTDVLVFLNNDVSTRDTGWLRQLVGWFGEQRVGAVGPKLVFPNERIQHMGVVVGRDQYLGDDIPKGFVPLAAHVGHGLEPSQVAGSIFDAQREVSALTGACLAVRADTFAAIGGFDEALAVDFQDVDLCLRLIHDQDLSLIYDCTVVLEHHESASRGSVGASSPATLALMAQRWAKILEDGDPFFSPHVALDLTVRPVRDVGSGALFRRISPRLSSGTSRGT